MLVMMYGEGDGGPDLEPGASELLSLARKIAAVGRDAQRGSWGELRESSKAAAMEEAKAAILAGEKSAANKTRVLILLPRRGACGAIPAVVSAMREITDAGVIRNLYGVEVREGSVGAVTALVSEMGPLANAWGPAPYPIALAVTAVALWAIRKDQTQ
jgi:hypothetical protein